MISEDDYNELKVGITELLRAIDNSNIPVSANVRRQAAVLSDLSNEDRLYFYRFMDDLDPTGTPFYYKSNKRPEDYDEIFIVDKAKQ